MITRNQIKTVFQGIPKGTTLTVSQIQEKVAKQYPPTSYDWAPYVSSRTTTYPRWHHEIQCLLYDCKMNGSIMHNKNSGTYTF